MIPSQTASEAKDSSSSSHSSSSVHDSAVDLSTTAGKITDLKRRLDAAAIPSGKEALQELHQIGHYSARERIEILLDSGSFVELDALARHRSHEFGLEKNRPLSDGVVTGYGLIDGRQVCVFSQDSTVFQGRMGEVHGEKIIKVLELAIRTGTPIIGLYDGLGARPQEGVAALSAYAKIIKLLAQASGVVPQYAAIFGPTMGANVHPASLADFLVLMEDSYMVLTDAQRTESIIGENTTNQALGGAAVHSHITGLASAIVSEDKEALAWIRDCLTYVPENNRATAPLGTVFTEQDQTQLAGHIPDSEYEAYDMYAVIESILDADSLYEIKSGYAPNIITTFARVNGRSVAVVANQPQELAGAVDSAASEKAAQFIRFADAFNIPILFFVDTPGFLPGTEEENQGQIHRTAKLFYALAESSVGIVSVVIRKAFGSAGLAMGAKDLGADVVIAWPTAQIALADADDSLSDLYVEELAAADETKLAELQDSLRQKLQETYITPYIAAARGLVDIVINPADTRTQIQDALVLIERKLILSPERKHDTMPL